MPVCKRCGGPVPVNAGPGRPAVFCSPVCRIQWFRHRRAVEWVPVPPDLPETSTLAFGEYSLRRDLERQAGWAAPRAPPPVPKGKRRKPNPDLSKLPNPEDESRPLVLDHIASHKKGILPEAVERTIQEAKCWGWRVAAIYLDWDKEQAEAVFRRAPEEYLSLWFTGASDDWYQDTARVEAGVRRPGYRHPELLHGSNCQDAEHQACVWLCPGSPCADCAAVLQDRVNLIMANWLLESDGRTELDGLPYTQTPSLAPLAQGLRTDWDAPSRHPCGPRCKLCLGSPSEGR